MAKVSCILPAYNEEPRIEKVLQAVYKHPLIDEMIVVDDGSQDRTKEVVKKFKGVKLIAHEENRGKSQAVVTGITQSQGNIIFLLDADLVGLTPKDISDLIEPVLLEKADISISLRGNTLWIFKQIMFDYLSGDRVFHRELVQNYLGKIQKLARFGLEVYLNKLIIKDKCRVKVVFWPNVITPLKFRKSGLWRGIKEEFLMNIDILKTISIFEIIHQITKIYSLKVK